MSNDAEYEHIANILYDRKTEAVRVESAATGARGELHERLLAHVAMIPEGRGCWIWTGYINAGGYGRITVDGRSLGVHRLTYEMHRGPIPEGLQLDHLCRVRCCCNPWHLEAVTSRENTMRGDTVSARNAAKTHCRLGHLFSPENTSHLSRGGRQCRECHKARLVQRRAAIRNAQGRAPALEPGMKRCTKCGATKPLSGFKTDRKVKCGYGSWCRECDIVMQRDFRARNLFTERERDRQRYDASRAGRGS